MTDGQRKVLVAGLGVALAVVAVMVNRLWASSADAAAGWFAYAPSTDVVVPRSDGEIIREALVWLMAVGAWVVVSLQLMRRPTDA